MGDNNERHVHVGATRARPAGIPAVPEPHARPGSSRLVVMGQRDTEIQAFGTIARLPIALDLSVCAESVYALNQILADTMTVRDLYKKHHWQAAGATFHDLRLMFDKHHAEQVTLIDDLAERIHLLGGVSLAMAADIAEITHVPRPPRGREPAPVQLARLLEAHEIVIREVRLAGKAAMDNGDDGTNDFLVGSVLRTNELQVWSLAEHLVDGPVLRAD
jgi:starvation-inducible DNA-binding protein